MQHTLSRNGPTPLWLHLNASAAMMVAVSEGADMMGASRDILAQAMKGVQAYHDSQVKSFRRPMKNVAQINGTSAITSDDWTGDKYVILIPSLVNSWRIFDIEAEFSFANYLNSQGLKSIIIDWDIPQDDTSMDDYIMGHLIPIIRQILSKGHDVVGMLGYCMGGTMLAGVHAIAPDITKAIKKTIMIAPPWDFSYQSIDQSMRLQMLAVQSHGFKDVAPHEYIQSLFWAVDPLQVLKKFRKFPNVNNADRFVRIEDWLNEGRAVSKSIIQTCLFDWYRDNKIINGQWVINDVAITQKSLPKDTVVVAAKNDNLVPLKSIEPLMKNYKSIIVDTGHIGLMASDKSITSAWKPIADFCKNDTVNKRKKS